MALFKLVNGVQVQMTAQEEADFIADQAAQTSAITSEQTTENTFKSQLRNALSSVSGKTYDTITAAEVRLLVAVLMHKEFKAIDRATKTYKNPNQWII